jgi:hypothetical protein
MSRVLHDDGLETPIEQCVQEGLFEYLGETLKVSMYFQGHVTYFYSAFHVRLFL